MSTATASTSAVVLYEHLVSLLLKCPKTIEILPGDGSIWTQPRNPENIEPAPSFSPFLYLEENLGIPQKILYQVYLYAVGVFQPVRNRLPTHPTTVAQQNTDFGGSVIDTLIASSSVLVLTNPSHGTALNVRKHLVRMRLIDAQAELRFMASLLSSQHCAKHAELWYHRRWILSANDHVYLFDTPHADSYPRLQFESSDALQRELKLVSQACELYPRNYFAWTHRTISMRSLLSDYLAGTDTVGFVSTFRREIAGVKEWIDRHVSDYSGIHYILSLSQAAFQSKDSFLVGIAIEEDLLDHAMSLVQGYPSHESLWLYIRSVVSLSDLWRAQQTQQFIDHFVQPLVHSQYSGIGTTDDLAKASQYAKQFLKGRMYCRPS